jgi:LPXTG-motif cell wall-anchored protein
MCSLLIEKSLYLCRELKTEKIMLEKLGAMLIDLVKYALTGLFIYPLLAGLEKDVSYYTIVGISAVVVTLGGLFLQRKKRPNDNSNSNNSNNN